MACGCSAARDSCALSHGTGARNDPRRNSDDVFACLVAVLDALSPYGDARAMARAKFLAKLPSPDLLKERLRLFAMHDAIVAPKSRSFEFHPTWGPGKASMGAFKDGEGNFFFAWISPKGAVVRGVDHESVMAPFRTDPPAIWPGIFDGLPSALAYVLEEPAFAQDEVTFAFWAPKGEAAWKFGKPKLPKGKDPDGLEGVCACLLPNFERWRKGYYDTPSSKSLAVLYAGGVVTEQVVRDLTDEPDWNEINEEAALLRWPTKGLPLRNTKPAESPKKARAAPKSDTPALAGPRARSFGQAEFFVRCEPRFVRMGFGKTVVAEAKVDVYGEIFDLVKERILRAKRTGK